MFPTGLPGLALLLLRASVAIALLVSSYTQNIPNWLQATAILVAGGLFTGYLTPIVAIGALVTIRERRNSPAPNGGWPAVFESWHRLGMFAIVTVLVAALFADDAGRADEIVMTKSTYGDEGDEPV